MTDECTDRMVPQRNTPCNLTANRLKQCRLVGRITNPRRMIHSVLQSQAQRITAPSTGNNQLLYFTSPSLTVDDLRLVFISDRTGHPNLFLREILSGRETPLTDNHNGTLRSYVYFDGTPLKGLGKASLSLDPKSRRVFYIQDREIRWVGPDGRSGVLNELPADQITAFTHVSADGSRLCVPTTDAAALGNPADGQIKPSTEIDARIRTLGLKSYLRAFDTITGTELAAEPVAGAWITHVQFSPLDRQLILYNHEWCADSGFRRMWIWDGKRHRPLRSERDGRQRSDWTCHEMWERDGSAVIYHGNYANGPSYIGRVNPDGSDPIEIPLPSDWKRYGHFTVGSPGELVTDGYLETPDDAPGWAGAWISRLKVDWSARQIEWFPLVRHGSSWSSQDAHPHPVFDHAGDSIWFTSDVSGQRAVYRVEFTR